MPEHVDAITGEITEGFAEPCPKCRGKGMRWFGRGNPPVPCKPCEGTGTRVFKAPAEKRAQTREKAKARAAKKLADAINTFKADYPAVWLWMETASGEFAGKMRDALLKYGSLTERQMAVSVKISRGNYAKERLL